MIVEDLDEAIASGGNETRAELLELGYWNPEFGLNGASRGNGYREDFGFLCD
jgi:hypothetical protein